MLLRQKFQQDIFGFQNIFINMKHLKYEMFRKNSFNLNNLLFPSTKNQKSS
jgi:hypothetical protein